MSAPKRTPGPWKTMDYLSRAEEIHGPEGQILVMRMDGATLGDMLAMAAATELLEALREIADDYSERFDLDSPSTNPGIKSAISQARAAIAKATGGQA
jgi:hypothetical protein